MIHWELKPFADLTAREVHDLFKLRVDVFVIEQRCVYAEIDGLDPGASHLCGRDSTGALIAYARILPPNSDGLPHIGRVIVRADKRGSHLGRHLMHEALRAVDTTYGDMSCALAAQAYLVPFYASFGFIPTSAPYDWDGIPHVDMELRNGQAPFINC